MFLQIYAVVTSVLTLRFLWFREKAGQYVDHAEYEKETLARRIHMLETELRNRTNWRG